MVQSALQQKTLFVLLISISGFLLFYHLGKGSLWDWDEAIYASVAKEMVDGGDYLSPHLNGKYWPEKPPLLIWCMAGAYRAFGVSEFSARLPAAIFGLFSVILIYRIGARFFERRAGLLAGFLLVSNLHFLLLSRMAMLDVPLAFFISAALYFIWLGRDKPAYLLLAGAATGLAVMTKSLVGFFPFLIMALSFRTTARALAGKWPWILAMALISVLIAAPWHIHQMATHGRAFVDSYFVYHLWLRTVSVLEGHGGTVFYYFKYVFEHFFTPWLCLSVIVLIAFGPGLIRRCRENESAPACFTAIWLLAILAFFTFARTKVAGYIVPGYIPLALLTARLSLNNLSRPWFRNVLAVFAAVTAVQIGLLHPLGLGEIDKSAEIKELAPAARRDGRPLFVFNLPPNAPTFYFGSPVTGTGDAKQLDTLLARERRAYLLCRKRDTRQIRPCLDKYGCRLIAVSRNQNLQLFGNEGGTKQTTGRDREADAAAE